MSCVDDESPLPTGGKVPNGITLEAMVELEQGKGKRFDNIEALLAELSEDD